METKEKLLLIGGGLVPHKDDTRDILFGQVYTLPRLEDIDDEFSVGEPLKIKDQKESDICAAASSSAVSEDQEEVELDMLFQFACGKAIQAEDYGTTIDSWGCDLRSMAKGLCRYGSLELKYAPYSVETTPRATYADLKNYAPELLTKALEHKKESFMWITGPYDFFDNIRATMWKNRNERKSMLVGTTWCPQWTGAPKGIIDFDGTPMFGHALKLFSVKRILELEGEMFLEAQLSNGTEIGDNGKFYFNRSVINKYFTDFGGIIFTDMPKEDARYHIENGIKADGNWLWNLIKVIINAIFNLKHV